MGIAVAVEGEYRTTGAVRLHVREQPDLAGAAAHLVGLVVSTFRKRRQSPSKFDDIAVAVVPLLEQREILNDFINRGHNRLYKRGPRNGQNRMSRSLRPAIRH